MPLSLQMDQEVSQAFYHAFAEEVALQRGFLSALKQAGAPIEHVITAATKTIAPHVPAALVGMGLLYGGKRLKDDIQAGEAMRRQGY